MDALNINNSLLTFLSQELRTSLQPFSPYTVSNAAGSVLTPKNFWSLGDYLNFMIGIPFCDSEDFMGGISTSRTVQIELCGDRLKLDDNAPVQYRTKAIYIEDVLLKIRAVKQDGRSQIEITNASIKQIMSGIAVYIN